MGFYFFCPYHSCMKKDVQEQIRNLAAHIESARENERKVIAREIHDELGQALSTLKLELALLKDDVVNDAVAAAKRIDNMSELLDETIRTVKNIITKIRPRLLDDLGLTAAIEWQAKEFQKHSGIVCELTITPEEMAVDAELSTALFRIFQETLTNAARHSHATRVTARLMQKNGTLEMHVDDNGRGIRQEEINDSKSFGLMGIQERVRNWGGNVEITGTPGKGTSVAVRIPFSPESRP